MNKTVKYLFWMSLEFIKIFRDFSEIFSCFKNTKNQQITKSDGCDDLVK